jgi:hypothetical protein
MAIVISEFEIVPEPVPETQAPRPAAPPAVPRALTPYELALAIAHEMRREARVKAD